MKHKEKRLECACQYQTMSAKEWRKVFSVEKKFNLDGSDNFQKYWHAKKIPVENYSTRHCGRELIIGGGGASHLQENIKLQFVCGRQKAADYVKMLNYLFLV